MRSAYRQLFASVAVIVAAAGLGCGSDPDVASDEGELKQCKGAKRDSAGKCRIKGKLAPASCCAAPVPEVDLSCDVVEEGVHELEEGFGSYYAITNNGSSDCDEDAEDISVTTESGGVGMSLGQMSWSPAEGDRVDVVRGGEFDEYVLHPSGSKKTYTVRTFSNQLGVVLYKETPLAKPSRVGTLDCRGVMDEEPEVADVKKMDRCNVVWVDYAINDATLEHRLGSIYDIDSEGNRMADGDSLEVRLVPTADEREVSIGQAGFSQTAGDVIDIKDSADHLDYIVKPSDTAEIFTVRIFRDANDAEIPGIGLVLYQKTSTQAAKQLAVIDCRGIEMPDEI